jgi:hypothetical protein
VKPSALQREHPALPKMEFFNFVNFFMSLFALQDPDPIRIRNKLLFRGFGIPQALID